MGQFILTAIVLVVGLVFLVVFFYGVCKAICLGWENRQTLKNFNKDDNKT